MADTPKPVIFLAFANDRAMSGQFLRNLAQEADLLRTILKPAEAAGYCEIVERQSSDPNQILEVFLQYKERIVIFHYAGHAEEYNLLLETPQGQRVLADMRGLADFLRAQTGLQLVFLNACSTRQQVQILHEIGVPIVIATSQAVDDELAKIIAKYFYQGLAAGDTIKVAYERIKGAISFAGIEIARHLRPIGLPEQQHTVDGQPWRLSVLTELEDAVTWSLPQAAGDPCFGLPPLSRQSPLPKVPFRGLAAYGYADASLFFGRCKELRELYNLISDEGGAPLILLYGQSGVGKSSLLEAGLIPRLEAAFACQYVKRDPQAGLTRSMITGLAGTATEHSLGAAWAARRTQAETKPLVVILDQVEEAFTTNPNADKPDEFAEFLDNLKELSVQGQLAQGDRIILGFRKEWLAEIEKGINDRQLQRRFYFLRPLEHNSIIEAVTGIAETPRLHTYYGLSIEYDEHAKRAEAPNDFDLPTRIAADLLADQDSPLAPTLQILLTKMWERAKEKNFSAPRFTHELYIALKDEGLALKDFLEQQLNLIKQQDARAVESGFVLDVLEYFTTDLGTAGQHSIQDLQSRYAHQVASTLSLIARLKSAYLLVDSSQNQPDRETVRLVHDALAPLIHRLFVQSDAPGQRARRLFEHKSIQKRFTPNTKEDVGKAAKVDSLFHKSAFSSRLQLWLKYLNEKRNALFVAPLDKNDLRQVEAGKAGMRARTAEEEQLVKISRRAHRRRAIVSYAMVALIGMIGALNLIQRNQRLNGQKQEQIVQARSAAISSLNRIANNPIAAVQLAVAVLPGVTPQPYVPDAEFAYTEALQNDWEIQRQQVATALRINAPLARREDVLAIGSDTVTVMTGATLHTHQLAPEGSKPILGVAWNSRGDLLSYTEGQMQLWRLSPSEGLGAGEQLALSPEQGRLACAEWRPNQQQVAVCLGKTLALWQPGQTTIQPIYTFTKTVVGDLDRHRTRWSPQGHWLAAWDENKRLALWNAETAITVTQPTSHTERIWDIAWSPSENYLVTVSGDGTAKVWSTPSLQPKATVSLTVVAQTPTNRIDSAGAIFLNNEHFLTWGFDNIVRHWSVAGKLIQAYVADGDVVTDAKLLQHDGETWVFAFLKNGRVQRWAVQLPQDPRKTKSYIGHTGRVLAIDWNGDYLATASLDGTARIWDAATGAERATLIGHQAARNSTRNDVLAIFWEKDQSLVTVGLDGTVRRWRFDLQKDPFCKAKGSVQSPPCYGLSHVVKLGGSAIQQVQWLDDTTIVAVDSRGRVSVWPEGQEPKSILPPDQDHWVRLSPDGKWLVARQKSGGALARDGQLWDVLAGKQALTLTGSISQVQWLAEGPLVSGPAAPPLLYPLGKGEKTQVGVSGEAFTAAQATTDQLATVNEQGLIQIWAWPSAALRTEWAAHESEEISTLRWRAGGKQLLTATTQGALALWDAAAGKPLWRVHPMTATVSSLAFSPDEHWLAVAQDQAFFVLDANTGLEHKRYETPGATVNGVQWVMRRGWAQALPQDALDTQVYHYLLGSSGERFDPQLLLMTWGGDGQVHFWHWDSLVEVLRLRETRLPEINNRWPLNVAVLNSNLARLVTAGNSRELRIWQLWLDQPEHLLGVWTARQSIRSASQ